MRFDASDEQQQLQATTRRFLENTVPLTAVRLLAEKNPSGYDSDWWRHGAQLGWTSLLVPENLGGSNATGTGLGDLAIVAEERGRLVSPGPLLPTNLAAWTLAESDMTTEIRTILDGILSGEMVCALVVGEGGHAGPGSKPAVGAVERGDSLELSGLADAVESGADADYLLVVVHVGDAVAHVLVTPDVPGIHRRRAGSLDLVRRHATVRFDSVVVPRSAVVVGIGRGQTILKRQRQIANIIQCAEMVGSATRAFEITLEYAGERRSFGRPLASYQVLKHRLADMKLWLEASQAAVEGAVEAVAGDTPEAARLVSGAKLYVGQKTTDLIQDCIQIHGGIGLTWEHDLHLYLRRVTTDRQLMGTPADHALHLASLLGL